MFDIVEVTRSLRDRVPFDVSLGLFKALKVSRGRGWSGTLEKLAEDDSVTVDQLSAMAGALTSHALAGEKHCRFYRVQKDEMSLLRSTLSNASLDDNAMRRRWPLLLNEQELKAFSIGLPTLIAVEQSEEGTAAIFSSVRAVRMREAVDTSTLSADAAATLSAFDEVFGLRLIRSQAIDVIWLPSDGDVLEVRVDFPKGMTADLGEAAQNAITERVAALAGFSPFTSPINLFPLINAMYEMSDEGRVVELGFGTTTRSTKLEKMRLNADCLRTELYHVGGKDNLTGPIRPYKLSISYTVDLDENSQSNPEVNLHSTSFVSENVDPTLFVAIIRKCVGVSDYSFVRDRLIHFVEAQAAALSLSQDG